MDFNRNNNNRNNNRNNNGENMGDGGNNNGVNTNNGNGMRMGNTPVIPLPNPGEGGPVYSGDDTNLDNTPLIPLPTPEQSTPVYPEDSNIPIIPLPTPEQSVPVYPDNNTPVIPLPTPEQSIPVYPGNNNILSNIIGTIITTFPRPNAPCRFCNNGSNRVGVVRFLNAASDYNPFQVYINSNLFVNPLNYSEVTEYEKVSSGMQTVSVLGENGYIYIQKQVMVSQNQTITIAIINTSSGLDLEVIRDIACSKPLQAGCIRVCNLAVNAGSLNVVIGQRYITFNNVEYMDVTEFKTIWPRDYNFYISRTNMNARNAILSATLSIEMNVSYTMYLFHWNLASSDAIRALIVAEH